MVYPIRELAYLAALPSEAQGSKTHLRRHHQSEPRYAQIGSTADTSDPAVTPARDIRQILDSNWSTETFRCELGWLKRELGRRKSELGWLLDSLRGRLVHSISETIQVHLGELERFVFLSIVGLLFPALLRNDTSSFGFSLRSRPGHSFLLTKSQHPSGIVIGAGLYGREEGFGKLTIGNQ